MATPYSRESVERIKAEALKLVAQRLKTTAIAERLGLQWQLLHYWLQADEEFATEWNRLAGRKQMKTIEWRLRIQER